MDNKIINDVSNRNSLGWDMHNIVLKEKTTPLYRTKQGYLHFIPIYYNSLDQSSAVVKDLWTLWISLF